MRTFWNLMKLAIAIPVAIILLVAALGIFGALVGLAVVVLRVAIFGLIVWGAYRIVKALFGRSGKKSAPGEYTRLAPVDRYYEEAKRELDRELGHA
jgi:hypothetical protein